MKRLILLVALVVLLVGSSASAVSDTSASIADSNIPDNEITTSQTEVGNSSASGIQLLNRKLRMLLITAVYVSFVMPKVRLHMGSRPPL